MDNIEFQLYDWLEGHNEPEIIEDEEEILGDFIIHSFGRCDNGKSVYAKITGYTPYFYIILPNKLQSKSKANLNSIINKMTSFFKDIKKIFSKYRTTLKEIQLIKQKKAEGFTNDAEFYFARLVFNNADGMKKYKSYLENNDITIPAIPEIKSHRFKLYEANLPPMLRCFHIRDISGCSWVSTNKYNLISVEDEKESYCDIEINIDWRDLNPIKKDNNAPFRICSFDIECNSIDGEFPQARRKGDSVIQIGATYTILGQSIPYRQYVGCLNKTDKIDNIIVDSFDTEDELMMGFLNEILNNDCDIITGYNIFFFDEKYIYDRCKEILKIDIDISYLSKLKNHKCNFKEMKLASSALGENLLRFWETPGRVHIDLMKDIQKTFNLPSYKLDYVASKFIRGEITSYQTLENQQFELQCKSVNDIYAGDYIHLEVIKGFVSDEVGEKYLVLSIDPDNKKIIVKGDSMLAHELDTAKQGGIINWSQAKDDVGPKDIFRLQKGSPSDRAIIAKYCVKDCKLVNLLINKLEVVTKNIEMANVCYIPLSYLFIRGQGIKLFSLCLKEFRKQKYIFPVIKVDKLYQCSKCKKEYLNLWECPRCKSKKREEVISENNSYEGAIVFDPVPKVDYEALATKDYMSLYPASIMHKNMSHETIIENPEFDNLEGIKYYNAQFREFDGSIQYRRFAQIDNKLGVIPTILDNLLRERKSIKKLMGKEKDPFKYKILDAKQLAVKITANSLYGQLGASTSPVCKRDIAACTTSTGREMLILAKKYDEEILPSIINSLKYYYNNNDLDKVNIIYDLELKDRNNEDIINNIKTYVNTIRNLTFQPVIRYGDTDSIFSCYRFRENTTLVEKSQAISIFKNIINFAKTLIEPYMGKKERKIFIKLFDTFYYDKIDNLIIPEPPECCPIPEHNQIILPLEDRIRQFIREYILESYLPWLWTLAELVEKDYIYMFDIKLTQWAEHQLNKYRLSTENLYENRKQYLMKPIMEEINQIFNHKYTIQSDQVIINFANKFMISEDCFPFVEEIKLKHTDIIKLCQKLFNKTIKDKWIYNNDKKELLDVINEFLGVYIEKCDDTDKITHYLIDFINENISLDINKQVELLNHNLLNDEDLGIIVKDNNPVLVKGFIEKYKKKLGKKQMEEIIEEFIENELGLSFDKYKKEHYNTVIEFIKTNLRELDMSQMDTEKYFYYWVQPRWDFVDKKIYMVDIYKGGDAITDKRTLDYSIEMGKLSGELIKSHLPFPHDCEYEKTFYPFAILTKKRYVGNKYEFDPNKYKQDFMGIVLKRRDNAPIVKEICGGIIDYLINHRSPEGAKNYTKKCIQDMFDGKYDIKYFLQSRTLKLKESYADWRKIAHVYLADKIAQRDAGNTPQSGDRIEFAVIKVPKPTNGVKLLQGDIIETPEYIKDNNLEIDYLFYLTNQIMNPALQFLELVDKNAINIFNEFIEKYTDNGNKKKTEKPLTINKVKRYISEIKKLIKEINTSMQNNNWKMEIVNIGDIS